MITPAGNLVKKIKGKNLFYIKLCVFFVISYLWACWMEFVLNTLMGYFMFLFRRFLLFLPLFIIFSCSTVESTFKDGKYDETIKKGVDLVIKGKIEPKELDLLDRAYNLANQRDLSQANFFEKEDSPQNYERVARAYSNLKERQQVMMKVNPIDMHGLHYEYKFYNYDEKIIEYKQKAADYYYEIGQKALNRKEASKKSFREAYANLLNAKRLASKSYGDIDELLTEAKKKGIVNISITAENMGSVKLSPRFWEDILSFDCHVFNDEWVRYYIRPSYVKLDPNDDYQVVIKILNMSGGQEVNETSETKHSRKIRDGYSYVFDESGNVMKDKNGNDVKILKMKEVHCSVLENRQRKNLIIKGVIVLERVENGKVFTVKRVPIEEQVVFVNNWYRVVGDEKALTDSNKITFGNRVKKPFPKNEDLLSQLVPRFRSRIKKALYSFDADIR